MLKDAATQVNSIHTMFPDIPRYSQRPSPCDQTTHHRCLQTEHPLLAFTNWFSASNVKFHSRKGLSRSRTLLACLHVRFTPDASNVASTCILQSLSTTTTATSCTTTRRTQRPYACKKAKRNTNSAFPPREPDTGGHAHRTRARWW